MLRQDVVDERERRDAHVPGKHGIRVPRPHDAAAQRRYARLALGSRDTEDRRPAQTEKERHLHLDADAGVPGHLQVWRIAAHARIPNDDVGVLPGEIGVIVPAEMIGDRQVAQEVDRALELLRRTHVRHGHLAAVRRQVARHADPSAEHAEAHDRVPGAVDRFAHLLSPTNEEPARPARRGSSKEAPAPRQQGPASCRQARTGGRSASPTTRAAQNGDAAASSGTPACRRWL